MLIFPDQKNLEEIHITEGYITDVDAEELSQLTKLTFVDLPNCYITKIPDLSASQNLKSLYLVNNQIKDISVIKNMPNLTNLNLDCNLIRSIEPIKDSTNIELLHSHTTLLI